MLSVYEDLPFCNLEWQSLEDVLTRMKDRFGMQKFDEFEFEFEKKQKRRRNQQLKTLSTREIKLRLVQITGRSSNNSFTAEKFIYYANFGIGFLHNVAGYNGGDILIPSIVQDENNKIVDYVFINIQLRRLKRETDIKDIEQAVGNIDVPNLTINNIKVKCFPILLYFFTGFLFF